MELNFDEIGFVLDDNQYRDAISMVDMYHFYLRHYQYRKFRPDDATLAANRPRAMLHFAGNAIMNEVHEKRRRWTWEYFRERRDDRRRYVELYKRRESTPTLSPQVCCEPILCLFPMLTGV
jgi:vacuolar protein sorting-associated protein 13A/C